MKNLDLYLLFIALPIASFSELFFFWSFSGHPTYQFSFFQQSATVFLFWILLILIIIGEKTDPFLFNESFIFIFAGVAFLIDYYVMGSGITGLGGVVYDLLGEGTWFLQAGLNLFTDTFAMRGCHKMVASPGTGNVDVLCDLDGDGLRGVVLVNLLFVCHAIVVLIASFVSFGLLSSYRNLRCGEASGPLLAQLE
ncbi:uncharacterized protein LOC110815823 [Carica papaya]|uniref:uncharacterized protein LOC110815823 n=1 Tax=Carica papaya TaxID=3649 RepID=UPI000B8C8103|nr:uncharacterized protein LOC110815823 [Carica papaya]